MPIPQATLTGYEALSRPFRYVLECYPDEPLKLEALVGKPYTVHLPMPDGTTRPLNGMVFRAEQGPSTVRSTRYTLELRPWFLRLDQERTCAVFQDMSVPDIVTKVCTDAGFGNIRKALSADYPAKEYTVRYGETSFAFLSRIMAEAGIFYFFEHDESSHTLVMADSPDAFSDCAQGATLDWLPAAHEGELSGTPSAHVFDLSLSRQVAAASCEVNDYNPLTPETSLAASAGTGFPCLGYPLAGHSEQQAGEKLAGLRLDACESGIFRLRGRSSCSGLTASAAFTIKGHPEAQANARWVATEVRFTVSFPGNGAAEAASFLADIDAVPAAVRYRPLLPRTRTGMSGPLTGVVVGKEGEAVWTDQYGRCKIRFQWQTESDENASCWLRVAQVWTGNGYGALFLPRVGQEVIISFIGGDPDRPIVTGMVYNSANLPPWTLPERASCSGLLTRSFPDGESGNELRFDDKKDEELVYLHAQNDMTCDIENARTVTIFGEGGDALTLEKSSRITTFKEGNDSLLLEKGNCTIDMKEGDNLLTMEKGSRSTVLKEGNDSLNLKKGNRSAEINGDDSLKVTGKRNLETSGDEERKYDGKVTINVKGDYTLKVSGNLTLEAGGTLKLKSSKAVAVESDGGINVEAGANLALSARSEVSAKGTMVNVKANAKGEIDGGGMLVVKGGLVKIN